MKKRLTELQSLLKQLDVNAFFISDIKDIMYLSGFTGSTAYMLIEENNAQLFTDGRYVEQSKQEVASHIEVVIVDRYLDVFISCAKRNTLLLQSSCSVGLSSILTTNGAKVLVDENDILKRMRMVKSADELSKIKQQYKLAADAFKLSLPSFIPDKKEIEWAATLEYNIKMLGAKGTSFDTIVASGVRGALPHGVASDKVVKSNEPVIIDFGSDNGYTSDYTRMMYNGNDKQVLEVISIVHDALRYAIDGVKIGALASDVDKIVRSYIFKKGYGEFFNHSLGHGIGLDVHELPVLNRLGDIILDEGMVFTIEPGIYLPNKFGVRLEDTICVTKNGVDVLSQYLDNYVYKF